MTTTLTTAAPTKGPEYDRARPETREPWMNQRFSGVTASDIRRWMKGGAARRAVVTAKVNRDTTDISHLPAVRHGVIREDAIADWAGAKFGLSHCTAVYSHPENPRHMASPDGIRLTPFGGELICGEEGAVMEIKTSTVDYTPGWLDREHRLVQIDHDSKFAKTGFYSQMQWQMYVMNAAEALFVWETRTEEIDPETGLYIVAGPPEYAWIDRDQAYIDTLVEAADECLEAIDAERVRLAIGELPPVSGLPAEAAVLVAELLRARDAVAIAEDARDAVWAKLTALYVGEGKPDFTLDIDGFAKITVSTSRLTKRVTDENAMRRRTPALIRKYEDLRSRFTTEKPTDRQRLTITPKTREL